MSSTSSALLAVYALSAGIVSAIPTPDYNSISTREAPIRADVNITLFNDTSYGHDNHAYDIEDHNLTYGVMMPLLFTTQSYSLSRFLSSEERLD